MEQPEVSKNITPDVLTGIPPAYTLSATNEVEDMMINNFLNTLAEVSLSVASRKEGGNQ